MIRTEKLPLTGAELDNCARMVQYAGLAQGAMHALLAEVERQRAILLSRTELERDWIKLSRETEGEGRGA